MRAVTLVLGLLAAAVVLKGQAPGGDVESQPESMADRFLDTPVEPLTQFRAFRRLEASNRRFDKDGWLEVMTELWPEAGFSFRVLDEGGSAYIRNKVLRPILQGERDIVAAGGQQKSALTRLNYTVTPDVPTEDGLVRLRITPLRKEMTLLDGALFVAQPDADLVRIEGRLARNPSFWTRRVDIVRRYGRVGGIRVPLSTESVAQVRIAGPSVVRMTYRYDMVNGRLVESGDGESVPAEGGGVEH